MKSDTTMSKEWMATIDNKKDAVQYANDLRNLNQYTKVRIKKVVPTHGEYAEYFHVYVYH